MEDAQRLVSPIYLYIGIGLQAIGNSKNIDYLNKR